MLLIFSGVMDLIFSGCENRVHNLTISDYLGDSDHNSMNFNVEYLATEVVRR